MTERNSPEKTEQLHKGQTEVQMNIDTLYSIFIAGVNFGMNENQEGTHTAFHNLIGGKPLVEGGTTSWDVAHKITVVSDFTLKELKKALRILSNICERIPADAVFNERTASDFVIILDNVKKVLASV